MAPRALIAMALLTGCNTALGDGIAGLCLWRDVGAVYEAPVGEPKSCLRVRSPDSARVSSFELDPCDAEQFGEREVIVPRGEPVYRYSSPDITPGAYAAKWIDCPTEKEIDLGP